jgi:hypothetical protein
MHVKRRNPIAKPRLAPSKAVKRFATERDLVRAYLRGIPTGGGEFPVVHTELESANGIADVVRVRLRKDWARSSGLAKIAPQWAFALRALPYRRVFTTAAFAELAGVSTSTARGVLRTFEVAGFCTRGRQRHRWTKIRQPIPVASQIIAIEAKLSDWRRALAQAYRYLDFATQSWVLLDAANSGPASKNIADFKRLNVGLAVIGRETRIRKLFVPSNQEPKSPVRYWGVLSSIGRRTL